MLYCVTSYLSSVFSDSRLQNSLYCKSMLLVVNFLRSDSWVPDKLAFFEVLTNRFRHTVQLLLCDGWWFECQKRRRLSSRQSTQTKSSADSSLFGCYSIAVFPPRWDILILHNSAQILALLSVVVILVVHIALHELQEDQELTSQSLGLQARRRRRLLNQASVWRKQ